jgi:CRISPR-associated exonuclease Cas4
MLAFGQTPSATYSPKLCDRCSLIDICRPRWLGRRGIDAWLHCQLDDEED